MLGANAIANMPVTGKYVTNFDPVVASFAFETINARDVELVTMALRRSYSCGHDEISSYILTRIISYTSLPLSVIFNKSVLTGTVPQHFKIAKVIPIFKAGDNTKLINYRPISLLSTFSKVLERLIYNKVIKFIEKHKILSLSQYGFRSGHSTSHAIIDLTNSVTHHLDSGKKVAGLFLDISKAFDSLDHKILLQKLYDYGFRGPIHAWFTSYLEDRFQYVNINGSAFFLCEN
jgi:hypothetical protein